ncbi:PfkB family carbohydrate kinase [Candidatus Aminicenantes bacterium AC-708-M15]|jgi:sugar/nucleoside kinase (ribokinase family)|nr:PfkB family carbohydrate kinase [SCandidatus Aminicenantes bacterium Aminicenantia_JdfR_composite]MCP2597285.1 PfkB family carbohydrate kinase [Candidatus Aminicenantes bacterium AC-335-G13]MCP2598411.1 PfkB family carbohydrate kinase [Candidatus Aminicenantes bacterium AC-335-L06]MCP2604064.1 PfkB family carbohydrate kinase [Candidatus Aminicenantes bacterium AC-708-M15]MCP2605888.1 PfkB family carbohydrate kinase [Candidatus Aminicenantes bacterium AC-335-O07]MCP2618305.1 PfkB family carb
MSLLVVGSIALDTIHTPQDSRERILGGSCVYFALASSFFTRPRIVGVVGEDFPNEYYNLLKERDIDLEGLKISPGKTFFWEGRYDENPDYRETIKVELNVFSTFQPVLPEKYQYSDFVFLANIDPDLQANVLNQIKKPKLIALDSMDWWIEHKLESLLNVIKRIDVFFVNEDEAKMLTQRANIIKAGKELIKLGPSLIILKKGTHGALVFSKERIFAFPAHPVEDVIDPTGAGDTFAGGFMGFLDKKGKANLSTICKALIYGSVLASFVVEDFGVNKLLTLTYKDIKKRYREFKKLVAY